MKAISLTQPWATLCMLPARGLVGKRYETRSWSTSYRGPLAIHAAKGFPHAARELCSEEPFRAALAAAGLTVATLPLQCLLGTVSLTRMWRIWETGLLGPGLAWRPLPSDPERSFGDYSLGRRVFEFSDPVEFPQPIPWRGRLGLFDVDIDPKMGVLKAYLWHGE